MLLRLRSLIERVLSPLSRAISGAVLLREAARTSRRWQTYAARTAFSGVLMGILLMGMWGAVEATRTTNADTADLAWLGRGLFIGFSVTQTLLALVIAPMTTANAIVEETDERTMEMLVLTPLSPGQILAAKIVSRILVLVTVVFGSLPVMALVVNLGGVSGVEVLAVTAHTLTTVVVLAALGAFFALFTKSPALATMASASYAVPFFLLLPMAYIISTGRPEDAAHFSTFGASVAKDPSALITPLSYIPSLAVIFAVATPLFRLRVSNADFRHAFSDDVWRTRSWVVAVALWFAAACFTVPVAGGLSWWGAQTATGTQALLVRVLAGGYLWALFSALAGLGTWAFLRVGMDVVDGIDGVFTGTGLGPQHERTSRVVGRWPVWWREARPSAWISTAAPMFVTWALVMLAVFQTGWWIVPGGLLAIGALNAVAAVMFGGWLASRSISEERRRGTLEVLLATTLSSAEITAGKFAGAAMPTAPLLLLSLPLFVLGVPHLGLVYDDQNWWWLAAKGALSWIWLVPVWLLGIVVAMTAATQTSRPQSAFGVVAVAALAIYGLPAVVARAFPDTIWLTVPARIVAPPLAGSFSVLELALSLVLTTTVAVLLLGRYVLRLRSWVGALAVLLLLALSGPAAAAPGDPGAPDEPDEITKLEQLNRLRMVARPLADGLAREGAFTALHVTVENLGPGTVGTLSLSERLPAVDGSAASTLMFERPIELPEGTRKDVVLIFRAGMGEPDRELSLQTREGRSARAPFQLRPVSDQDVTVGVVGTDPLGLPAVLRDTTGDLVPSRGPRAQSGGDRQVRTGLILPGSMPDHSAGYGALDWVVWPAADPSGVSRAQLLALQSWVADGGHLLLLVSDTWRQLADSPLADAMPVTLSGQRDAEAEDLRQALGLPPSAVVPIAVGTLRPSDGTVARAVRASAPEGEPLWVSSAYGFGSIHVVTAELRGELRGHEQAWRNLLSLPRPGGITADMLAREPHAASIRSMLHVDPVIDTLPETHDSRGPEAAWEAAVRDHLDDIPGVSPLPLSWLAAFATIYLLAIGPFDYLVLRLLGRQPLTWLTFPALIVVFSVASLAMTQYTKGSQAVVVRVEVVDLLPGTGLARGQTWLSVFSTRKTQLSLESGYDDALIAPLLEPGFQTNPVLHGGVGPGRLSYGAETWTLAYARSDWTAPLQLALSVERTQAGLQVRNDLPFDLADLGIILPSALAGATPVMLRLGALPRGGTVTLPQSASWSYLQPSSVGADPLAWASYRFHSRYPTSRGALGAEFRPVLIGVARDQKLEPIALTGLSPIEQPLLIVRQPMGWERELKGLSAPEPDATTVVMQADPNLYVSSAYVDCGSATLHGTQQGPIWTFEQLGEDCVMYVHSSNGPLDVQVKAGDRVTCAGSACQVSGSAQGSP
jgi:ABC-type transport system involved in multi-copper enzyme maturation permease subunit